MTTLLNVPRELRDRIYSFAMDELPTRFLILPETTLSLLVLNPATLPNFAFTCRQLHLETFLAYLSRTRFILGTKHPTDISAVYNKFLRFLDSFPNDEGFNAIRMLTFSEAFSSWDPPSAGYFIRYPGPIVRACPGIQRMTIRLEPTWCLEREDQSDDDSRMRLATKEELEDNFNFSSSLFRMRRLRHLRILLDTDGISDAQGLVDKEEEVYRDLLELIYDGFGKERLQTLKVDVEIDHRWERPSW